MMMTLALPNDNGGIDDVRVTLTGRRVTVKGPRAQFVREFVLEMLDEPETKGWTAERWRELLTDLQDDVVRIKADKAIGSAAWLYGGEEE